MAASEPADLACAEAKIHEGQLVEAVCPWQPVRIGKFALCVTYSGAWKPGEAGLMPGSAQCVDLFEVGGCHIKSTQALAILQKCTLFLIASLMSNKQYFSFYFAVEPFQGHRGCWEAEVVAPRPLLRRTVAAVVAEDSNKVGTLGISFPGKCFDS